MQNNLISYKEKVTFIFIIFAKLLTLVLFSSSYSQDLFLPFVKIFINVDANTWQYYFEYNLNIEAFPYHPLMLYILSVFTYPISFFDINNIYIVNLFFKLPLFISDIVIFCVLLRLFKDRHTLVIIFYFLNPIIFYSTYIHSQLDIIPTSMVLYSIYLLIKSKLDLSALVLGLAIATKTHVFLAIPLLFIYIHKGASFNLAIRYVLIACFVLLFFDFPYLFNDGFLNMVLLNKQQSLLFDSYFQIGSLKVFLPIFSILVILGHLYNQKKVNVDLLYAYLGILFSATIYFVAPSPGWYVWIVPFISIYVINSNTIKAYLLYSLLSIFYLVFFIVFFKAGPADIIFIDKIVDIKISNDHLINLSFTLLEFSLAAILFTFYKYGIKSNNVYKKITNVVIGIGGDSGVGKTSLLQDISLLLGNRLLMLEGDGEHKWERGSHNWNEFTHLNPKANHIHNQANAIFDLKHDKKIKRSDYDHHTGKFTTPKNISPKKFISLSGLHPFYLPSIRKNTDLKIYIDTDENLRRHWKIVRDIATRGYTIEKILEQINKRVEDTEKYIYPQKQFANLIIKYYPVNEFKVGNANAEIKLGLKITFDANIHFEYILEEVNTSFEWDYNEDLTTQSIIFESEPSIDFKSVADTYILNLNEIIDHNHEWLSGYKGLIQLITLLSLSEIMKGKQNEI
tara:strand:+ start:4603 stop:6642 length:2040 start_codon:yes stop_codon:yes gene_type:complete